MDGDMNPALTDHLPAFVTAPGGSDWLLMLTTGFLVVILLVLGTLYLKLHSVPERMAHRGEKLQFEIVAVLGLIALFTHNHVFWIAGLLLAFVTFPDFTGLFGRMARAQEKIAGIEPPQPENAVEPHGDRPVLPQDHGDGVPGHRALASGSGSGPAAGADPASARPAEG